MLARLGMASVLFLVPLSASADAPAARPAARPLTGLGSPEALLARDSLAYFRFDGIESHRKAYDQTALAEVMSGDVGTFVGHLSGMIQEGLGRGTVKDKLLAGIPPDQLVRIHAAARRLPQLGRQLSRHGFLAGFEMLGTLPPRGQLTLVFPNAAAAEREAIFAGIQLMTALNEVAVKLVQEEGRAIYQADLNSFIHLAYWQEGEHVICTVGTERPDHTLELLEGKRPNLTARDLYRETAAFDRYEAVVRGFVDVEGSLKLVRPLAKAAQQIIDGLGADGIKSVSLHFGFAGRCQRSTIAVRMTGERKGILRLLTAPGSLTPDQFAPVAPDAQSVSCVQLDPGTFYDVIRQGAEVVTRAISPDNLPQVAESFEKVDKALGFDLRKELLGSLGSKVMIYNSAGEGFMGLGVGLAVQVKDEQKLSETLDSFFRALPALLGPQANVGKRNYRGVDVYTIQVGQQRGLPFTPSWGIHKGWLVLGPFPQTVHGFVQRADGKLARWKPAPQMAEVLAEVKKDPKARVIALTESDPRRTLKELTAFGPFLASTIGFNREGFFDAGLLPNFQAVTEPLFPNVGVVLDDGNVVRQETYGSLSLPFDPLGLETYWFGVFILGNMF